MGEKILRSPLFTVALFVLAAVLMFGGTVGVVQAAPRTVSDDYVAQVMLDNALGVTVVENDKDVSGDGELLGHLRAMGADFKIGSAYPEAINVRNTGNAPEYVRVTVRKYWADVDGKRVDLDPSLIKLILTAEDDNAPAGDGEGRWIADPDTSSTEETAVYYWSELLRPGDSTADLTSKLAIDGQVIRAVTQTAGEDDLYDYHNVSFHVKVTADAVQEHNREDAMLSVWGHVVEGVE